MAKRRKVSGRSFTVERDRPLIGILLEADGRETVRYFTDEDVAVAATPPATVQRALDLLGSWSDIDTDDALDKLDRIRHQSKPTPPFAL